MALLFFLTSFFVFVVISGLSFIWPSSLLSLIIFVPLFLIGLVDFLQKKRSIRRNFPVIGNFRYILERIRPELQQYFVESNLSGRPVPRELRSIIYQRAKKTLQTLPFGTQRDIYDEGHEWANHSMRPVEVKDKDFRVTIGGKDCKQPYSSSILNISAMSYGALSKNATEALNKGAAKGRFYHNTGEGGVSQYHRQGGDLVWQIGTGYFGCRTKEGHFCPETFAKKSQYPEVKMIEIKISQGAKPGKGGILPGVKVTQEVADIRGVEMGKSVISPSYHKAFSTPKELLIFVKQLRDLSGGKPVGFKICVGRKAEFFAVCKAMVETGIAPDFIAVDGAEGGTGAAPLEFSNSLGEALEEGLAFVHDALVGFGLRDDIKIIAAGKVFTAFHILNRIALGADLISSARGMMLALGCIQALQCNSNRCPSGVATTDPHLVRGLHIPSKIDRVAGYHEQTLYAFSELLGAMGYTQCHQLSRQDIFRRVEGGFVKSFAEIFPYVTQGAYLKPTNIDPGIKTEIEKAQVESFQPKIWS